jgi:hypothetical protein
MVRLEFLPARPLAHIRVNPEFASLSPTIENGFASVVGALFPVGCNAAIESVLWDGTIPSPAAAMRTPREADDRRRKPSTRVRSQPADGRVRGDGPPSCLQRELRSRGLGRSLWHCLLANELAGQSANPPATKCIGTIREDVPVQRDQSQPLPLWQDIAKVQTWPAFAGRPLQGGNYHVIARRSNRTTHLPPYFAGRSGCSRHRDRARDAMSSRTATPHRHAALCDRYGQP